MRVSCSLYTPVLELLLCSNMFTAVSIVLLLSVHPGPTASVGLVGLAGSPIAAATAATATAAATAAAAKTHHCLRLAGEASNNEVAPASINRVLPQR